MRARAVYKGRWRNKSFSDLLSSLLFRFRTDIESITSINNIYNGDDGPGRAEINIVNNTELHINAQYIFIFIYDSRPKNTSSTYDLKQEKFKINAVSQPASQLANYSSIYPAAANMAVFPLDIL